MSKNSKYKWIDAGYELCAKEGAEGIQTERLARILNLNKSGFYHYFENSENFLKELLKHHLEIASQMALETAMCRTLDPDYFQLAVKYKVCLLFQGQLLRKENISTYKEVRTAVNEILDKEFLPLGSQFINLTHDPEAARQYFNIVKNSFFLKANYDNLDYELLYSVLMEAKQLMHPRTWQRKQCQQISHSANRLNH